ncbi:MAG: hypothetical protein A2909_00940 [Candidatus Tagabacteria bacterium RIFCSPLOWO2_01_FULL_39_11]|uniref:Restriction endonuclease n=1 Tax=Candidatus Tagabacteria bacterium RIFCSPLOWO2_01_FULL_39_11 TaxID=1802295 RepID=A0A1G2LPC7_9BACT|nr:MAG: hypothetical protein A2909_00940 [Candidatus Tagabacteria bacterium RIFCSPLOWO2_01_FULL_39_11]
MEYIKSKLSDDLAKKILGSKGKALAYLLLLSKEKTVSGLNFKTLNRGKNKGSSVPDTGSINVWKSVVDNWDYEVSKKIIREMFKETEKYKNGKDANAVMDLLIKEWETLKIGKIEWPFSQGGFDGFVQRINSGESTGFIKDEKVKIAAVKYRRIKEINTVRNDFIETLIFEKNQNILPTLNHRRGVDFFIAGISYDQKVAKSPTNQFKNRFKDVWREEAIKNPALVAEYLYKYQDEGRFGDDPRLLVVYLDEDVSIQKIREIINNTNLDKPIEINFSFKHKIQGDKNYKVPCFVILLHN